MTAFLDAWGVDRDLFIILLVAIIVVLLAMCLIMFISTRKLFKRYDCFMRGRDAESLEDLVVENHSKMFALQDQEMTNRDRIKRLQAGVNGAYQKTGIVRYNAFDGMGGQSSFVLAMLDSRNTGIILNAMHSRSSCYLYIKEVKNGESETLLGSEEKEALKKAMES